MFGSTEHIWQNLSAQYRLVFLTGVKNNTDLCIVLTTPRSNVILKLTLMNIPLVRRYLSWSEFQTTNTCRKSTNVGRMNILLYALAYEAKGLQAVQLPAVYSSRILVISKLSLKWQHLGSVCFVFQHPISPREIMICYSKAQMICFPNRLNIIYTKDQILLSFL